MIEFPKKQPLVSLALAIAAGYVLAHIATRSADYFYEYKLDSKPESALILAVAIALMTFLSTYMEHDFYLS